MTYDPYQQDQSQYQNYQYQYGYQDQPIATPPQGQIPPKKRSTSSKTVIIIILIIVIVILVIVLSPIILFWMLPYESPEHEYLPPIASFTYSPSNPVVNQEMRFDASSSSDPESTLLTYSWDLGDGTTKETDHNQMVLYHTFKQGGSYNVALTVINGFKKKNSTEKIITVLNIQELNIQEFTNPVEGNKTNNAGGWLISIKENPSGNFNLDNLNFVLIHLDNRSIEWATSDWYNIAGSNWYAWPNLILHSPKIYLNSEDRKVDLDYDTKYNFEDFKTIEGCYAAFHDAKANGILDKEDSFFLYANKSKGQNPAIESGEKFQIYRTLDIFYSDEII